MKVRNWVTICFLWEIFIYTLVNKYNYSVKKCLIFPDFFEIKRNEMNSSWFRLSFIINNEQIEPNLNSVFVIKYDKIQCWPRNYDKFWEIVNSLISILRIFIYNQPIWKITCFWVLVLITLKVIEATFDFSLVLKYWVSKTNIDNE